MPMFMWAQSLGWEDPQEEGMATHLSILAWEIPWTEELGGVVLLSPWLFSQGLWPDRNVPSEHSCLLALYN